MALSDKNLVITPNIGSSSDDPKIVFSGADASTSAQNITLKTYPTNSGTLSFEGSAGQLFSITNSLSGTIFSVNDVSGIPSIEVLDTGLIKLAQYSGNILLGTATDNGVDKLQVNGSARINKLTTVVVQETATYITASTATTTIDLSLGTVFIVTISSNTTFAFTNIPTGTNMTSFSIITINDATAGRAVSWPAAVTWTGGTLPPRTTTANKSDAWTFFTNNSGTTIVGSLSVTNF